MILGYINWLFQLKFRDFACWWHQHSWPASTEGNEFVLFYLTEIFGGFPIIPEVFVYKMSINLE